MNREGTGGWTPDGGYQLLDAGDGRRLEAFGSRVIDRPAPVASDPKRDPDAWAGAVLRYDRTAGWQGPAAAREPWTLSVADLHHGAGARLELRPTTSGQVGLFPEHLSTLPWLRSQVASAGSGAEVLNLFAYTGLATLAVAAAGASVVHVDAARSAVAWARHNAGLSGLADRPIRWIVEDAMTFVERELRRGRRYHGFVIDPPSWGHAPRAGPWRLDARLHALLAGCASLAAADGAFCLLTAHRTGLQPADLQSALAAAFDRRPAAIRAAKLALVAESGVRLELGVAARLPR
jgi:23S rRNA (cytosine1962-C5)-methyltransferase